VEAIVQKHAGTYFGEAFEGNKVNVKPFFCQGEAGKPCYYQMEVVGLSAFECAICHNFQKKAIEKKRARKKTISALTEHCLKCPRQVKERVKVKVKRERNDAYYANNAERARVRRREKKRQRVGDKADAPLADAVDIDIDNDDHSDASDMSDELAGEPEDAGVPFDDPVVIPLEQLQGGLEEPNQRRSRGHTAQELDNMVHV
jgi:hypothetical protein